jgi:hypothetical protein
MSEAVDKLVHSLLTSPGKQNSMGGDSRNRAATKLPVLSMKPVGQQIQSIYTSRLGQFTDSGMNCSFKSYLLRTS